MSDLTLKRADWWVELTELRGKNEKLGWQIKVEKREDREKMKRFGMKICFYIINNVSLPRRCYT